LSFLLVQQDKQQRKNAKRAESAKAAKDAAEADRLERLAQHKRQLEQYVLRPASFLRSHSLHITDLTSLYFCDYCRARIAELYKKNPGGKQVSGGMKASVGPNGKLIWE
jgi:hypothetical protein